MLYVKCRFGWAAFIQTMLRYIIKHVIKSIVLKMKSDKLYETQEKPYINTRHEQAHFITKKFVSIFADRLLPFFLLWATLCCHFIFLQVCSRRNPGTLTLVFTNTVLNTCCLRSANISIKEIFKESWKIGHLSLRAYLTNSQASFVSWPSVLKHEFTSWHSVRKSKL